CCSAVAICWSPEARPSGAGSTASRRWRAPARGSASPTGTGRLSRRQLQTNIERIEHVDRLSLGERRLVLAPLQRLDHRGVHEGEALHYLAPADVAGD